MNIKPQMFSSSDGVVVIFVGRLLSLALDGRTASSSTQVRTDSQLTRAHGPPTREPSQSKPERIRLNVVVVLAWGWLPAGGCRSVWSWCSWGSFLPALGLGRFFCLLFAPFSFRATSQRPIISGLRPRASHSCSRTGGTSGRSRGTDPRTGIFRYPFPQLPPAESPYNLTQVRLEWLSAEGAANHPPFEMSCSFKNQVLVSA